MTKTQKEMTLKLATNMFVFEISQQEGWIREDHIPAKREVPRSEGPTWSVGKSQASIQIKRIKATYLIIHDMIICGRKTNMQNIVANMKEGFFKLYLA